VSLKDVTQSADLLGAVARVPKDISSGRLTQDTVRLVAKGSNTPWDYIYWLLQTPQYRDFCWRYATGTTTLGLGRDDFLGYPVPDFTDQRRSIVQALDSIERRHEELTLQSELLHSIARATFKSWFVDFDPVRAKVEGREPEGIDPETATYFPGDFQDSELGSIPAGWLIRPIGELASIVGGSTPSTKNPEYWDGEYAWATPKDLSLLTMPCLLSTERKITHRGLGQISSGLLEPGTVLLSSRAPIGYLAIAEIPTAINQGFIAMKPVTGISNLFLLFWTMASHEAIISRANGSTFLEISKSAFRPIPVVTPSPEIMASFDKTVRPLYEAIVNNEKQVRTLTDLRDTLLPRLSSGKAEKLVEAVA
jgi:type I restriction enzyme S subunit